ncbi:phage holin family protein [Phormidium sp. LEGE 05292]|uniref:phage holin family protein n=1 Tax=[Phormidium] sp. LEGE 05292 TaxID=767427 RepID=UPI00187EB3D3|nr:phage holin family protein [Phormidium sp. LEGE 05292]MBE9227201.1 phage holin family protein [Phormidium sp. LEGE 05292]
MVANAILDSVNTYANRLIRIATVLVDMHLDIAMREAEKEKKRLIGGLIMLAIGVGLMTLVGLLAHAIAIWFIYTLTKSWINAILILTAIDFFVGSIFLVAASRKLSGPYMVQTQARVARTTAKLMENDQKK